MAAAANALHCFRPPDRPVFWRMLIAQARLYQGLVRSRATTFRVPVSSQQWADLRDWKSRRDSAGDRPTMAVPRSRRRWP